MGQPAMIIASAAHREGILEHLNARLIHVDQARRSGDLLVLDADETLALFMVDGVPVPELFDTNIGRFIEQVLQGRPRLDSPGLWRDGRHLVDTRRRDAAIRLEILWNALATRFGLALLCGYAMGNFFKQVPRLREIAPTTRTSSDRTTRARSTTRNPLSASPPLAGRRVFEARLW